MESTARCERCAAPLMGAESGAGVCPACLLELGLDRDRPTDTPAAAAAAVSSDDLAPDAVERYRILATLGQGGMGVVYLAEQLEPVRRRVALKIIKRGMDTRQVIARFESERQALAMMDHPAIARVYDAGASRDGRPYFAMELVEGEPVTTWCDRSRTALRERLELFARVCDGVHHAHRKGIIHRDLKPSNVLVTEVDGGPAPKIIDFGIAKAIEPRLADRALVTELGVLVGTPEYMSPEQAAVSPLDVDTRTDVYGLGVLLYELLTGVLPFEPAALRDGSVDDLRRRIRETDPPTPSSRLGELGADSSGPASRRRLEPDGLRRALAGDLDRITMKALEKEPARRYDSAADFAADVRRHLRHEPVAARAPSRMYRAGKFLRRHAVLTAASGAVIVSLAAGAVVATRFALSEARQRREAERARGELERVVRFQSGMLSGIDAHEVGRRMIDDLRGRIERLPPADAASGPDALERVNATDAALRLIDEEILARSASTLDTEFADEPAIESRLRSTIAATYERLGLLERAAPHAERAVDLAERAFGADHERTIAARTRLAELYSEMGRYEDAERAGRRALDAARHAFGDDDPRTAEAMNAVAILCWHLGRYDEAEPLLAGALAIRRRALGEDDRETIFATNNLAILYTDEGRYDEAEPLYLRTLELCRGRFGGNHRRTLAAMNNLAVLYRKEDRPDRAERLLLDLRARQRSVLGAEHPDALRSSYNLGSLYVDTGRPAEAERLLREVLAAQRRVLGEEHKDTLATRQVIAGALSDLGRYAEAEAAFDALLAIETRVLGDEHPYVLMARRSLAGVYAAEDRVAEAETLLERTLRAQRRVLGEDHPSTRETAAALDALRSRGPLSPRGAPR